MSEMRAKHQWLWRIGFFVLWPAMVAFSLGVIVLFLVLAWPSLLISTFVRDGEKINIKWLKL